MRKTWKKLMTFALAGTMAIGMSVTAFAAANTSKDNSSNYTTTGSQEASDTTSINLIKDYTKGSSSQSNTSSPAENFIFTITPYGVWNAGSSTGVADGAKYNTTNMPLLGTADGGKVELGDRKTTVTISATKGNAETDSKLSQVVTLPEYKSVGDFWYKVEETDNNVAGVIYGTNDAANENNTSGNNAHEAVYYLHVQVTNDGSNGFIRTVTLHKTAPTSTCNNTQYNEWTAQTENQGKKVNDIQNKYYAGSLKVKKKVTGNAGDKNKLFEVTVTFKNDSGASMNSDIVCKNFYANENAATVTDSKTLDWKDTVTVTENSTSHTKETFSEVFYVKDDTTVTFDNIPYGVSYTVNETQPSDDKYTHSFAYTDSQETTSGNFNGLSTVADTVTAEDSSKSGADKWNAAQASGSISDDSDTVTITNNKENTIDVGVITSNAPYIAMLLVAGVAVVMFIRRRREMIEE